MASWAGSAGSRRKQSMELQRRRVQQKLDTIHDQRDIILQAVDAIRDNVNAITAKAEEEAQVLMAEKDASKMMHHMTSVNTRLEEHLNQLIVIQYSLQGGELDTETSDCDSLMRETFALQTDTSTLVPKKSSAMQTSTPKNEEVTQLLTSHCTKLPNSGASQESSQGVEQLRVKEGAAASEEKILNTDSKLGDDRKSGQGKDCKKGQLGDDNDAPSAKDDKKLIEDEQTGATKQAKDKSMSPPKASKDNMNSPSGSCKGSQKEAKPKIFVPAQANHAKDGSLPDVKQTKECSRLIAEDRRSLSSNDGASTFTTSTGDGHSTRRKKKTLKKKKVAELLRGVDKIVTETPLVEAELPFRVDYGQGPAISGMELTEGDIIEVFVTEMFSPSFFWVQPFSPGGVLDDMADRLNLYYGEGERGWDQYLSCDPAPGMVVCARFTKDENWYRARIIAIHRSRDRGSRKGSVYVDVLYVDYGNRDHKLALERVRALHPKFSSLPCQAFPCALSQAGPPYASDVWPEEVRAWFSSFLAEKERFHLSIVVAGAASCPLYVVELYYDPRPALLGQHLVNMEVASLMHSVLDVMVKSEYTLKVDNQEVLRVYREYTLTQPVCVRDTESLLQEIEIHVAQAPTLLPSEKSIQRTVSLDSEDFKSQVVGDDSFDKFLDEEIQNTLVAQKDVEKEPSLDDVRSYKAPEPVEDMLLELEDDPPDKHSAKKSLEFHSDSGTKDVGTKKKEKPACTKEERGKGAVKNIQARAEEAKKTPSKTSPKDESVSKSAKKNKEKSNKESKQVKKSDSKPKSSASPVPKAKSAPISSEKENTSQTLEKTDKNLDEKVTKISDEKPSDENPVSPIDAGEQSHSESSPSIQQKLLELGMPEKVPSACGFAKEFQTWIKGDNSSLEAIESITSKDQKSSETSQMPKSSTKPSEGADSSCVSSDSTVSNDSKAKVPDGLDSDQSFEPKQFAPQEVVIPEDEFIRFLMAYIESPSKFWIHLVSNEAVQSLDNLKKELNQFYSKDTVMIKKYFDSRELKLYTLCCAQYVDDSSFYRAKIIGLDYSVKETVDPKGSAKKSCSLSESAKKISQVQVFYVDFGDTAWIPVTKVYPLPPKFTQLPPQAICCALKGVEPIKEDAEDANEENEEQLKAEWTMAACKAFEKLTGYRNEFVGYIVDSVPGKVFCPDLDDPLPLLVVDTNGPDDVYVHEELARQGLAASTQIHHIPMQYDVPEGNQTSPVDEDKSIEHQAWNPMAEDFLSERNSYMVDNDDPAVATMGYKPQDEGRVCRFYNTPRGCYRRFCPYEHVDTSGQVTTDKKAVCCALDVDHHVSAPGAGAWVILEVSTVLSPGHFYAIFPFSTRPLLDIIKEENANDEGYDGSQASNVMESVEALMDNMSFHYESKQFRDTDYTTYAEGEIVACLFTQDNRWYRARIIASEPERERVQVFYVDFGNTEWLPENRIRSMESKYMHLPFQALECFLPIEPIADDGCYTKEARDFFWEFVDGKVLFAEVLESGGNAVMTLSLYDTTDGDLNIEKLLVEKGYAKMQPGGNEPRRPAKRTSKARGGTRHSSQSSSTSSGPVKIRMLPG